MSFSENIKRSLEKNYLAHCIELGLFPFIMTCNIYLDLEFRDVFNE